MVVSGAGLTTVHGTYDCSSILTLLLCILRVVFGRVVRKSSNYSVATRGLNQVPRNLPNYIEEKQLAHPMSY